MPLLVAPNPASMTAPRPLLVSAVLLVCDCASWKPLHDGLALPALSQTGRLTDGLTALQFDGDFPLRRGQLHFVARGAIFVDYSGQLFHGYDVALYLNVSSRVWTNSGDREAALGQMMGDVAFVIMTKSTFLNKQAMADLSRERMGPFAEQFRTDHYQAELEEFADLFSRGPEVKPGMNVTILPTKDHLEPLVSGISIGKVESSWLGPAFMEMYIGKDTLFPEFGDAVWAQLSLGVPDKVSAPLRDNGKMVMPPWVVVLIVIVAIASLCCYCSLLHWSSRSQAAAQGLREKP